MRARLLLAALLAASLLAGCGSGGDGSTASTTAEAFVPAPVDVADLEPCGVGLPARLRCGNLDVPLERKDLDRGETSIRFAVLPRSRPDKPEFSPIVAVEGGPGYGSIGSARTYIDLFGDLLHQRDLILVDARGTGGSGAINCRDLQKGTGPSGLALAGCARQLGDDFDSYRTAAAADDIDAVREALGRDIISLYGDSYGTFLAQSYAFRHEDTLDSLVLDSAYPVRGESGWYPSIWKTGIHGLTIACDRDPDCPPGADERLAEMVEQLRKEGLGVGPLIDAIANAGYSPPRSYLQINKVIAQYLDGYRKPYERLAKRGRVGYGDPEKYSFGQELTISCNDYPMIWDKEASEEERRVQLEQEIREYPEDAFEPFTPREIALGPEFGYLECLSWPQPGPLYEPPAEEDAPSPEVPTLVVAGELDNVTSPEEGRLVAEDFPNSELFVGRNSGHVYSLYDSQSPEAKEIRRFIRRHSLPARQAPA